VRFLLDEMISEQVAPVLEAFARIYGDAIDHIVVVTGRQGTPDEDIPGVCAERDIDTLISINVKDFGAREVYFQGLLDCGIHVVILRAPKQSFDINLCVSFVTGHFPEIKRRLIRAAEPTLLSVTHGGVRDRTLKEVNQEFQSSRLP
jgi:hypothetical protein